MVAFKIGWIYTVGYSTMYAQTALVLGLRGFEPLVSSDLHNIAPSEGIRFDNLSGDDGYHGWRAYGQSKLANVLFARELARRFEGTDRAATAVHPGVIQTDLNRHMNPIMQAGQWFAGPFVLKTVPQGAATSVYAAIHPDAGDHSGEYLVDSNVGRASKAAADAELAQRLWSRTEEIVGDVLARSQATEQHATG